MTLLLCHFPSNGLSVADAAQEMKNNAKKIFFKPDVKNTLNICFVLTCGFNQERGQIIMRKVKYWCEWVLRGIKVWWPEHLTRRKGKYVPRSVTTAHPFSSLFPFCHFLWHRLVPGPRQRRGTHGSCNKTKQFILCERPYIGRLSLPGTGIWWVAISVTHFLGQWYICA